jgi:hypothetical protein
MHSRVALRLFPSNVSAWKRNFDSLAIKALRKALSQLAECARSFCVLRCLTRGQLSTARIRGGIRVLDEATGCLTQLGIAGTGC